VLMTPSLFHLNFGVLPLDQIAAGQLESQPSAAEPWNYFRSIPTYVIRVPQRSRRTYNLPWHNRALRIASRGKHGGQSPL